MSSALHTGLPSQLISAFVTAKPEPSCTSFAEAASFWPGVTKVRSFACFTAAKNGMRVNLCIAIKSQPEVWFIVSIRSTPGIKG